LRTNVPPNPGMQLTALRAAADPERSATSRGSECKKLAAEVVREESEKTPMARKVHAPFTKFQALVGPWDHVAEGAYHQLVAG